MTAFHPVPTDSRQIVLASRPEGEPVPENFRLVSSKLPPLADGQILLQTIWLSLDPYMRGRMSTAKSYSPPVELGSVMVGGAVSRVIASRNSAFAPGEIVQGRTGWQSHPISDGTGLVKVDPALGPISTAVGVLGMPGMTAYVGLKNIGQPKPGETLVVAAASGAVGSLVGQIARLQGCRVVGIAGGAEKVAYVRDTLGFDVALDHRAPDFPAQLAAACPKGVDIYWENVGGAVWDAVFPLLNDFARVPVCGLIAHYSEAQYGDGAPPPGPDRSVKLMRAVLAKRLTLRGFVVSDFAVQQPDFLREVSTWLREGRITYKEDIVTGLEKAPEAFIGLLKGRNFGKLLVKVSEEG
ncbi:MAG TPA: NADP-dependent oxidoreductase [Dongiaceae bacterium]|nr:NADP-dependent oxidoreductase [Dongiaceae bacterium]